jgi:inosine-uridine nucleoside N-ribohydrolase
MRRLLLIVTMALTCAAVLRAQNTAAPRMVIIDQDASGPGGSDQMAMMVLLQSPLAKVLGITVVTGDAWEPEEVQHTLRMLEIIHRTDVPVLAGAVFPLVRNQAESMAERAFVGTSPWYGAWTEGPRLHGPYAVPPLKEGEPTIKPLNEDAAHFLVRQVHAHPHEVTIYAAGPLTNIALALAIDPQFAELTQGIVIMGGSMSPQTDDPEFATHPRHEFNFWFDPEAAHIVLRAGWPRVDLTTVDISVKTLFSHQMMDEIGRATTPAAQYVAKYTTEYHYLWDELAAAAWLDPKIITKERVLYVDVDLTRGPNYGDTLTWTEANRPRDRQLQPVHVQEDLDGPRFYREFVELMKAQPRQP